MMKKKKNGNLKKKNAYDLFTVLFLLCSYILFSIKVNRKYRKDFEG